MSKEAAQDNLSRPPLAPACRLPPAIRWPLDLGSKKSPDGSPTGTNFRVLMSAAGVGRVAGGAHARAGELRVGGSGRAAHVRARARAGRRACAGGRARASGRLARARVRRARA